MNLQILFLSLFLSLLSMELNCSGVNKNGPLSALAIFIRCGFKWAGKSLTTISIQNGKSVRLAGGITVPFSKTNGTGEPSH